MIRLGNRKMSRKFMKGVCVCAMACAVTVTGIPAVSVTPLVQAEENTSWVYDDDEDYYVYTDANGWKYKADYTDDDYCYLLSVPDSTTGEVKYPRKVTIDGVEWKVYVDSDFEWPEGVILKTAWVYDEEEGCYYYTDANGWKYYTYYLEDTDCYLEEIPADIQGELTIPATILVDDDDEKTVYIDNSVKLPSGVTSLVAPAGVSVSDDFFENANSELVVYGYSSDELCQRAADKGIKVEYYDVFTDSQGVQYDIHLEETDEGYQETGEVGVFGYTGTAKKVTIPKTVKFGEKEYKVVEIDFGAFYKNTKITGITLPSSITSIGSSAFYGCKALTSIKIPNSVSYMGDSAFSNCSKLKTVTFSSKLSSITPATFYKCTSLTSITVPNNIEYISNTAFYGCSKLKKVTLGTKVTGIGMSAFAKCTKLTTVTAKSKKLDEISDSAFNGDKVLKTITLKTTKLTKNSIGKNAFKGTNKKLVIKVPSKKVAAYKKFITKFGNKTITVKKG